MNKTRSVQVIAFLLTTAAVGDDERRSPLELYEVKEAQPRDSSETLVVEQACETEARYRGGCHRVIDEEQRRSCRRVGKCAKRLG